MAWEQRRGRSYYYRKVRQGSRVSSVYVGSGCVGELAEEAVALERLRRQAMAEKRHAFERTEHGVQVALASLTPEIEKAYAAAGFHCHRGCWRRVRHG